MHGRLFYHSMTCKNSKETFLLHECEDFLQFIYHIKKGTIKQLKPPVNYTGESDGNICCQHDN